MDLEPNSLGLPEFKVLKVEKSPDDTALLFDVEAAHRPNFCYACGAAMPPYKHGPSTRIVHDTKRDKYFVYLRIHTNRFICNECGHSWDEKFPCVDEKKKTTTRLKEAVVQMCMNKHTAFTDVANFYNISDKTVSEIFNEWAKSKEWMLTFKAPEVLGIDEAHIDNHFRAVIVDTKNNKLLEMLPNNKQEPLIAYFKKMDGINNVSVATMDFCDTYPLAVKAVFPFARIVIDHYHVIQDLNRKMTKERIAIQKELSDKDGKRIKGLHKLFMANKENLTDWEKYLLREAFKIAPELQTIYNLKEGFRDIYTNSVRYKAEESFDAWCDKVPVKYKNMTTFKNTILERREHVFNYFDCDRVTNAYAESANNIVKGIEKIGSGYKFSTLRLRCLFYTKATKPARIKYDFDSFSPSDSFTFSLAQPKRIETIEKGFGVDIDELLEEFKNF